MIVGQFVDTYPPCLDGVGRVTQSYCETLMSMGHEAWYIAPKAPGTAAEYAFPVLLQHSVKLPGEQFRLGLPGLDIRYRRRLEDIPFDIVHAQSPFAAGEEALRMARRRQVPLVSTFHSKYYQDFYDKTKSKVIAQGVVNYIIRFYNQCDGVWTVNHATAQVLREYGYHGKIRIMENGTNREPLSPEGVAALNSRVRLGHDPVLLFVGQHNYKKNIHGILDACALLKQQGQAFQLITAGDGPDMADIRREVEEKGLQEQTHLLGFMSDREELMALAKTLSWVTILVGAVLAVIALALVPLLFQPVIFPLFKLEGMSAHLATTLIVTGFACIPLHAYSISAVTGILRAGGDVFWSTALDLAPQWLVALPLTAVLGLVLDADPWFISLAIQMESFVKCPICLWRIRSKKWIHDVTVPEGEER